MWLLLPILARATDLPCGACEVVQSVAAGTDASGHRREVVRVAHGDWRGDWLVTSSASGSVRMQRLAMEPEGTLSADPTTVRWTVAAGTNGRNEVRVVGLSPTRLLEHRSHGDHGVRADDLSFAWVAEGLRGRVASPMCRGAVAHDSRTVPRVAPGGAWAPLGSCATTFDAASDVVWGKASDAGDAQLRVVMVSDHELWVEVSDDRFVTGGADWVADDHLELWLPVPAVEGCEPGSAMQWGIALDGTVHPGKGARGPSPTVEVDGQRFRIVLPAPTWWLSLHYSDSDGEGQERLVGTARPQGTVGASLARVQPAETLVRCALQDGAWQARAREGSLAAPRPELTSWAVPPCEDCEAVDAGTDAAGRSLVVQQPACGRSDVLEVSVDGALQYRVALPKAACRGNHWEVRTSVEANRWSSHSRDGSFASGHTDHVVQLSPMRELGRSEHAHDMHEGSSFDTTVSADALGATLRRTFGCHGDEVEVSGRGLARVHVEGEWGPLGRCATAFDASAPAWGAATTAVDARLKAVVVGPDELWVEVDDDVVDTEGATWVDTDHLELWMTLPVPADRCDDAWQWAIGLDGTVTAAHGAPSLQPEVLGREVRGSVTALRLRLPWPPDALGLVFSDADGEGQEALVGTHHGRGPRWHVPPVDDRPRRVCREQGGERVPVWVGGSSRWTRPTER